MVSVLLELKPRYYIILVWIWTTQIHYDVRYEAEDAVHRFMKLVQIALMVLIGAASGGWNPMGSYDIDYYQVAYPNTPTQDLVKYSGLCCTCWVPTTDPLADQAWESFFTITIAFAVTRALLAIQYLVGMCATA